MTPDLTIIIVTWNSRRDIEKCLHTLERFCTGVAVETIVFDNASADGTAACVMAHFPKTQIIRSEVNVGFARANNHAAEKAHGRHLLFLNPDTWVNDDLAMELVHCLDSDPRVGACAPRVLNPDGSVQLGSIRTLPTLESLFYDQTGLSRLFPRSKRFGRYRMTWWDHNDAREIEQAAGACLAIRCEVFKQVIGFDEGYFMFYEDVDLCHAILAAGWKIHFLPQARVYHIGGQSTIQAVSQNLSELHRSMYRYFRRHHSRGAVWLAKLIVGIGELGKLIVITLFLLMERFRRQPSYWRSRREQFRSHGRLFLRHWFY